MLATRRPVVESTSDRPEPRRRSWTLLGETAAVMISPAAVFFALRIRGMSPIDLVDPSLHTAYIVDPRDMFTRYMAALTPTARLREGAEAGFLVPARLSYLAFGAVPGFFVMRYMLALVAVLPAYLLVRRLYGIPAGAVAIIVLLSSPVVITAWGTDYPDAAVVSYVAGAVACLAMPCKERWRLGWIALAGVLFTLAVWSEGIGIVLVLAALAAYAAVRLLRDRQHLLRDGALLAGVGASATLLLMLASAVVLGQLDFIRPTIAGALYLNQPSQLPWNHSSNRHWVLYVAYLLVPPSVIVAFWMTVVRRLRSVPSPQLIVGLACTAQFVAFAYLQFLNHVQTLEMHYLASTLWGVVCLVLAITIAELSRPLSSRKLARWLPAAVLVTVPLAYEADPHVPAFGWLPAGLALGAVPLLCVAVAQMWSPGTRSPTSRVALPIGVAAAVVAIAGSLLVITVAPIPQHARLPGTAYAGDPIPQYAGALGGDDSVLVDAYRVSAELPSFVGPAAYKGEQLLMWYPLDQAHELLEPIGMYHAYFNSLFPGFPTLTAADAKRLAARRPAELLLLSTTGARFAAALAALRSYKPVLMRTTVLRQGPIVIHAWLVGLGAFSRVPL